MKSYYVRSRAAHGVCGRSHTPAVGEWTCSQKKLLSVTSVSRLNSTPEPCSQSTSDHTCCPPTPPPVHACSSVHQSVVVGGVALRPSTLSLLLVVVAVCVV